LTLKTVRMQAACPSISLLIDSQRATTAGWQGIVEVPVDVDGSSKFFGAGR
jgi:hypothetical protein